jgi:DNA-binding PadR family transcriptional regulator
VDYVKTMPDLNATAASLLGFLLDQARTGWELVETVESGIGDFWNVTRSQVYRELRSLEEAGYVEAGETGPRERRPYSITEAGREAFAAWIVREPGPDVIRSPMLLMVWFGDHLDEALLSRFLTVHRLRHEQRLAHYRALLPLCAADPALRFQVYALQFGIAHEEAVLRWMESLPWFSAAATAPAAPGPGGR